MKKIISSKHSTDCVNCGMILLSYDVRLVDGNMHYCLACAEKRHAGKERRTYKAKSALNIVRGWRWRWRQITASCNKHLNTLSNPIVKLCLQFITWLKNNQNGG